MHNQVLPLMFIDLIRCTLNLTKIVLILTLLSAHFAHAIELNVSVYDPQEQPIKDIVVYVESSDSLPLHKTKKSIEINQLNKSFAPYIGVVQSGNEVRFHNQDDITHHIYSPVGDNKFEFKILSGQQKTMDSFITTGEVAMGCNIHDWMSGHLLVVNTPYFNKTNVQGQAKFTIKDKGSYQLTVWHPQMNEVNNRISQTITLHNNENVKVQLTKTMDPLPEQKSEDDFDFLSDY